MFPRGGIGRCGGHWTEAAATTAPNDYEVADNVRRVGIRSDRCASGSGSNGRLL